MNHDNTDPQAVPSTCRWHLGASDLLIVAPHGGARQRRPPTTRGISHKVNDLHTAALAAELASDLDASFIINVGLDRNEIDLNRISQVRNKAPWFLNLLETLLGEILARHGRAEIVVLHGWNVVQAKCDFGIGVCLDDPVDLLAHSSRTVSPTFLGGRLHRLSGCLREAGVESSFGERYPARHPNNLLQLFRHTALPDEQTDRGVRHWATGGLIEAVQMELGIPLRWPGPRRLQLRAAARRAFIDPSVPPVVAVADSLAPVEQMRPPAALRFYDPTCGIGLMAGIDATVGPTPGVQGRVLVFLSDNRVALFTGDEQNQPQFGAGGPKFRPTPGGFFFSFDGSALATSDGRHYVDLEQALAHSGLQPLRIELEFAACEGSLGQVRGAVRLGEKTYRVDAPGFAGPGAFRRWSGTRRSEWAISATFGDGTAVVGDSAARRLLWLPARPEASTPTLRAVCVHLEPDLYTPERLDLHLSDATHLRLEPIGRMSILRPVARGRRARVTLGIARATLAGLDHPGVALYEYARLFDV